MPAVRIVLERALVALAILALPCAASRAQGIRPGLWEVRQQPQLDPAQKAQMDEARQQMAALPPDQRKMMESVMAQRGMSVDITGGGGATMKICVTPEQAQRDAPPVNDSADCKHTLQRDGKVLHTRFECTKPPSHGEGDITLNSPEAYSMKMRVTTQRDGRPQTMSMNGEGRWLAAECGDIKPRTATR